VSIVSVPIVSCFREFQQPDDWQKQVSFKTRPVVGVSRWEAMAFCRWAGVRLLTEAQWERAARGTTGRKYPWGNEPPDKDRANFTFNVGHPTAVGVYLLGATADGIHDLAGNVWEWCHDGWADYPKQAVSNPCVMDATGGRVIRGGSWGNDSQYCRSADRNALVPACRSAVLGFRVAAIPLGSVPENRAER
jgi:formylglycine-generating enzyme required for sulfatase activity